MSTRAFSSRHCLSVGACRVAAAWATPVTFVPTRSLTLLLSLSCRPSLPNHLQSSILHTICALLPGVAAHHLARGRLSRAPRTEEPLVNSLPVRPEVLDHLTIGLAGVTRLLQRSPSAVAQATSRALPVVIAVALQDVDPPSLVAHLPVLVAGWNGRVRAEGGGEDQCVRLVGLARGAEAVLVGALGLRRACVVAIHVSV